MNKKTFWAILALSVVAGLLAGCGDEIGKAPAGSADQAKKEFDAQPPEKQITQLYYAPMPPADKEAKIKAIEEKYHITRPAPPGGGRGDGGNPPKGA